MDDGVKFEKSKEKGKKYLAILPDGQHVNFGALGYQHYEDRTPLKLYSHLDHKDPQRRKRYHQRHKKDYPKYSADWFSKTYLW
jgi:hypothetical protein